MSANVPVLRAGGPAGCAKGLYLDAQAQLRLAAIVGVNLAAVALSFSIEDLLVPWQTRMESATPGWCFVLAQAGVLGFATAMIVRGGSTAVVQSLLVATLIGYAYVFAGASMLDPRRAIQTAQLVFRAVQLGFVSVAAMALGISLRLTLHQQLTLSKATPARRDRAAQFGLAELMFLVVVFSVGLGFVNLFFNYAHREPQLADMLLSIVRSLPAALPWLWGVMQKRLSWLVLSLIVASSVVLMIVKAYLIYARTGDDFATILELCERRAVAYAAAATLNGLLLRGLGFQWRRG